jgi:hypothetical protein
MLLVKLAYTDLKLSNMKMLIYHFYSNVYVSWLVASWSNKKIDSWFDLRIPLVYFFVALFVGWNYIKCHYRRENFLIA